MFPPKKSYVEALMPSVAMFGDGASKEVIRVKEVLRVGALTLGLVSLSEEIPGSCSLSACSHTKRKGHVSTVRW